MDIIWPTSLDEYLIDLKPFLEEDAAAHFPMLAASYTVNGKLIAMPYHPNTGRAFLSFRLTPTSDAAMGIAFITTLKPDES